MAEDTVEMSSCASCDSWESNPSGVPRTVLPADAPGAGLVGRFPTLGSLDNEAVLPMLTSWGVTRDDFGTDAFAEQPRRRRSCCKWVIESVVLRIADLIFPSVEDRPHLHGRGAKALGSGFILPQTRRRVALVLFLFGIMVSSGLGLARAFWCRRETFMGQLSIALLAGVPLVASVGAALLVDVACTGHLKTLAGYATVNWVAVCLANVSFILNDLKGRYMSLAAALFLFLACLAGRTMMLVFMRLAQRRVNLLEAVEIEGQVSLSYWQRRLVKAVRVVCMVWMLVACVGLPICEGFDLVGHIACRVTFWVLWGTTGLEFLLFFCWVASVIATMRLVRKMAVEAAAATKHRQEMECRSAAKAAAEQMVGVILAAITTLLRGTVVLIWTAGEFSGWHLWIIVWACQLDALGNFMMSLAMGGFHSHALSFAINRSRHEFERRKRWQRAQRKWRSHEDEAWQQQVIDLAWRGFTLEALLNFYKGLGVAYMPHFDPDRHTTADVVRHAVVPLSAEEGCALAVVMMAGVPTKPRKMVTHNWGNLFRDLVAAVCADAMEEEEYGRISNLLERDVEALEIWLTTMDKMQNTYWICALCVNQHRTICDGNPQNAVDSVTGEPYPLCSCGTAKLWNTTPPTTLDGESIGCEVNKFDDMMKFLSQGDESFEQVVAIDRHFTIFSRAWCVAELAAAKDVGMIQRLKFHSTESIGRNEKHLRKIRIQDMQASVPGDKEAILAAIPNPDRFNADLQRLLFEELLPEWFQIDSSEQMHRLAGIARWQEVARHRDSVGIWNICNRGGGTFGGGTFAGAGFRMMSLPPRSRSRSLAASTAPATLSRRPRSPRLLAVRTDTAHSVPVDSVETAPPTFSSRSRLSVATAPARSGLLGRARRGSSRTTSANAEVAATL